MGRRARTMGARGETASPLLKLGCSAPPVFVGVTLLCKKTVLNIVGIERNSKKMYIWNEKECFNEKLGLLIWKICTPTWARGRGRPKSLIIFPSVPTLLPLVRRATPLGATSPPLSKSFARPCKRVVNVTPIFKKGSKKKAEHHRPVNLMFRNLQHYR